MKKILLLALALCLICTAAFAEVKTVEAKNLSLNKGADTFVIRKDNKKYQVVDADLNPLSAEYYEINDTSEGLYTITSESGKKGLLNGRGEQLIAAAYDDIKRYGDRWAAGITLKEATAENYDYKSFWEEGKFYLIDTVDLYYLGTKLHTFTRMEFDDANAFGDYLIIQDREKNRTAYNKDFVLSTAVPESSYSEYNENWNTGKVIHVGSGQEAFTAGCTLTPDEVRQSVWIKKNSLVDLQGNVLADLTVYYSKSVDRESNMINIRDNFQKRGLMDSTGKVLISCQYDELGYDIDAALASGYLYAVKDGKGGFVSLVNGSEKGFEFLESAGRQRSAFIVIEDPREGTILISAAAGELPGRYKSADVPYSSAAMFATVEEFDGRIHVIDVFGNDVLEDNPEIRNTYSVEYSNDGTLILVQDIERKYHIYRMDLSKYSQDKEAAPVIKAPGSEESTWTCANGHEGNTGNFCATCGEKKPEPKTDDGTWTCVNGHEGNTGNFCTVCGEKKPEPKTDDGTWTCENGHAGNTGAFCGECGAKKPE